jgi:hypothetical protein
MSIDAEFLKPIRDYSVSSYIATSDHTLAHYQIPNQQTVTDIVQITTELNPHMVMSDAIQLWDYGLDQLYMQDWRFRKLYDLWCTTEYNSLPFDTFLIKCGIQLTDLEAAQTAIVDSIIPGISTSTSALSVDG